MSKDSKDKELSQTYIAELIANNLYDVKILAQLEAYLLHQVKTGGYDFEANRHLLKLYLFAQDAIKIDTLAKVLLKALMVLPETDFLACTYLVAEKLHTVEPVKTLLKLSHLLETTQFKKFWKETELCRPLLDSVPGFDDAIRSFITVTISSSYQSISYNTLKEYLHVNDNKVLDERIAKAGWTKSKSDDAKSAYVDIPASADNSVSAVAPSGGSSSEAPSAASESITLDQMAKALASIS